MDNGTLMQFFHWYIAPDPALWQHLADESQRLADMGITAVWMPPAFKGSKGKQSEGYDIYDLYDLGEFDQKGTIATKYGTKDAYLAAIAAVHSAKMQVYADIIINDLCGADGTENIPVRKVDPQHRMKFISGRFNIEAYTKFTYPGRDKYSDFKWDYQCFTGVDYAKDLDEKGIFSIQNQYGDKWQMVADREYENYDFLLGADIEYRNRAVREEIKRWATWYWQTARFDGIRLDAVKHLPASYLNEWLGHLRKFAGEQLFAVAEFWAPERLGDMLRFIDMTHGAMSLFDAPLHHNFFQAGEQGNAYDLRRIFDNTLVATQPSLAVTLVGNHDTQPLQLLQAPVADWFKPLAYALILLREKGYPCVFYPDLYGAAYEDVTLHPVKGLEAMISARSKLAYGVQRDYFDHENCAGWTREGGCAVVLSNGEAGTKRMEMGMGHAGKVFHDLLGNSEGNVTIDAEGWGEFYCPAGSLSVWVRE